MIKADPAEVKVLVCNGVIMITTVSRAVVKRQKLITYRKNRV